MKAYEISYLLNPELSQEETVLFAGKITQTVEKSGGGVTYVAEPKKRKLAYFLKKHGYGYFGYTNFNLETKNMASLKHLLDDERNILRYLTVEALKQNQNLQDMPLPRHLMGRSARATYSAKPAYVKKPQETKSEVSVEEIDKKLEEILK